MDTAEPVLDWTEHAINFWISEGIPLQAGISLEQIDDVENLLDFKFPQDFIELYSKVNGFKDFVWDNNMFSLWSINRILQEYREAEDKNYIGFCDYLISSHHIGFSKTDKGIFKDYELTKPIGNTFKEAIELINTNNDLIY
jgi:hypothetical protein